MNGFAYSRPMGLLLQLTSVATSYIFVLLVVNLALYACGEPIKRRGKQRQVVLQTLLYTAQIFIAYALSGFDDISDPVLVLLTLPNPLVTAWTYFSATRLLKLPRHKSVIVLRMTGLYAMVVYCLNLLIRRSFFIHAAPRYNYFSDLIGLLVCLALHIGLYHVAKQALRRGNAMNNLADTLSVKTLYRVVGLSYAMLCSVYALLAVCLCYPSYSTYGNVVALVLALLILAIDYVYSRSRAAAAELANKSLHMHGLIGSVERLSAQRQEYDSLLAAYGRQLQAGDLAAVRQFHESLTGKTQLTGEKLRLTRLMRDHPPLVSLLLQKIEYAQQLGVTLTMPVLCQPLAPLYLEPIDLCRVVGTLLDNAIEAAAASLARVVEFSVECKGGNGKLVVITNSTDGEVDIDKISVHGVTYKAGHTGLGLTQVRNTLKQYGNSSIAFNYYDHMFMVMLDLLSPDG